MKILRTIGRKAHTLALLVSYNRAHRKGVGVYELERLDALWFHDLGFETIIDIGANTGQFSHMARMLLPKARILAFEPLPSCFKVLSAFAQTDGNIETFNMALGNSTGKIEFQENQFSPSSSILPLADSHLKAYPFAAKTSKTLVSVARMDEVLSSRFLSGKILVKMDTQGYEAEVIDGGNQVIRKASCVIAEVSFRELYKGQVLFDGVYQRMRSLGFSLGGFVDQGLDPKDGGVLQANAIFFRQESV